MKSRIGALSAKLNPLAITCSVAITLALASPAFAASADTAGSISGFQTINGTLGFILNMATGNVAKIIAVVAILGGAAAMAQGREGHEALKTLGVIAFAIGAIIMITNVLSSVTGAIV